MEAFFSGIVCLPFWLTPFVFVLFCCLVPSICAGDEFIRKALSSQTREKKKKKKKKKKGVEIRKRINKPTKKKKKIQQQDETNTFGLWCVACRFFSFVFSRRVLHVFKLIDTPFGVAFADLPQRLVLVATLLDILFMQPVHGRLFGLVLRAR